MIMTHRFLMMRIGMEYLILENAIKQLYQNNYNSVSNQKKRELYRGTKGMWRPGYGWDGNIWPGLFGMVVVKPIFNMILIQITMDSRS